jgi:YHS domain-containing protein
MKRRNFWIAFGLVALVAALGAARLYAWMNPHGAYNTGPSGLALSGYDPVAYFAEGGGAPTQGDARFTVEHEGRVYRFASEENRARFAAAPSRYGRLAAGARTRSRTASTTSTPRRSS